MDFIHHVWLCQVLDILNSFACETSNRVITQNVTKWAADMSGSPVMPGGRFILVYAHWGEAVCERSSAPARVFINLV